MTRPACCGWQRGSVSLENGQEWADPQKRLTAWEMMYCESTPGSEFV